MCVAKVLDCEEAAWLARPTHNTHVSCIESTFQIYALGPEAKDEDETFYKDKDEQEICANRRLLHLFEFNTIPTAAEENGGQ